MSYHRDNVLRSNDELRRSGENHRWGVIQTLLTILFALSFGMAARADLWSAGYYPGWEQGAMPASTIDFNALTHIIHFSVVPNSNGTLNSSANTLGSNRSPGMRKCSNSCASTNRPARSCSKTNR